MKDKQGFTYMNESQLRDLASSVVRDANVTQAKIAEDLEIKQPTVSQALKGRDKRKYTDVLIRIIHQYSSHRVEGPGFKVYLAKTKK